MKSELRTELKSNLLADRIEEVVLIVKPHLKLIGLAVGAVAVAACIYGYMHSTQEKASAEAWSELYFSANRTEKLDAVYQDFPNNVAGLWARQKSADALTSQALNQIYIDRDLSEKLLEEARTGYRAVLEKAQDPMLVCRATYGLAQVLDSEGNPAEAAREFKKLLTLPGVHSEMLADAQRRIEFIDSPEGRAFYEWFKNSRPTAPTPVDIPANLGNIPSQPDIQFSTPPAPIAPETKSDDVKITEPSSEKSSSALTLPSTETPAIQEPTVQPTENAKPPALEPAIVEPGTTPEKQENGS
ncbi:MAG: hypothetical protein SGI77_16220 [Pirellulaceae bacterium]|nr:hypothetical protein [Pirellulaceae bacterium]